MTWLLENHRHNYPRFITLSPLRLIPPKKISMNIHFFHLLKKISLNIFIYIHFFHLHQHKTSPLPTTCVFVQPPCIVTSFVFVFARAPLYCDLFCICICILMYLYSKEHSCTYCEFYLTRGSPLRRFSVQQHMGRF